MHYANQDDLSGVQPAILDTPDAAQQFGNSRVSTESVCLLGLDQTQVGPLLAMCELTVMASGPILCPMDTVQFLQCCVLFGWFG